MTHTVWELADKTDAMNPDSVTSAGAEWLINVSEAWADVRADYDDTETMIHETADGIVPVSNYDCWKVFTDLGAWQIDLSDYSPSINVEDLTSVARLALYILAEQLITTLESELKEEVNA
jgi:hypothetical protein